MVCMGFLQHCMIIFNILLPLIEILKLTNTFNLLEEILKFSVYTSIVGVRAKSRHFWLSNPCKVRTIQLPVYFGLLLVWDRSILQQTSTAHQPPVSKRSLSFRLTFSNKKTALWLTCVIQCQSVTFSHSCVSHRAWLNNGACNHCRMVSLLE